MIWIVASNMSWMMKMITFATILLMFLCNDDDETDIIDRDHSDADNDHEDNDLDVFSGHKDSDDDYDDGVVHK